MYMEADDVGVVAHPVERVAVLERHGRGVVQACTANLPTYIVDFGGFDSSIILN